MQKNFLLLLLLVGSVVSACRKGDKDPFLSIKPREWRLNGSYYGVNYVFEKITSDSYYKKELKNGRQYVRKSSILLDTSYQSAYTLNVFIKGGQISMAHYEEIEGDTHLNIEKYSYAFLRKEKSSGTKNREDILLSLSEQYSELNDYELVGSLDGVRFNLVRLSNREVIMERESRFKDANNKQTYILERFEMTE